MPAPFPLIFSFNTLKKNLQNLPCANINTREIVAYLHCAKINTREIIPKSWCVKISTNKVVLKIMSEFKIFKVGQTHVEEKYNCCGTNLRDS